MNLNNKLLKNNYSNFYNWNYSNFYNRSNIKKYEDWYNNIFLKKYKNNNNLSKEEIIKLKKSFDKNLFEYFKFKKGNIYKNDINKRVIYEGIIKKNLEKIYFKLYKRDLYNDLINRNKIFDNYLLRDYNILNNYYKMNYKIDDNSENSGGSIGSINVNVKNKIKNIYNNGSKINRTSVVNPGGSYGWAVGDSLVIINDQSNNYKVVFLYNSTISYNQTVQIKTWVWKWRTNSNKIIFLNEDDNEVISLLDYQADTQSGGMELLKEFFDLSLLLN